VIKLERPLVMFDLETTGTDPVKDRIVQMAVIKLRPDGKQIRASKLFNPGVPIPHGASAVHGITDDRVANESGFDEVAHGNLHGFLSGCDLGGYNVVGFDVPLLQAEFARAGVPLVLKGVHVVDACLLFRIHEPSMAHTLADAVRRYLGVELEGAHDAMADVGATLNVLEAQIDRYGLPDTPAGIAEHIRQRIVDRAGKLRRDDDGQVVVNFGKHCGRRLDDLVKANPGYVRWMVDKRIVPDAIDVLQAALKGGGS
jgi:DNA polymerase-3 subunit epsilon